MSFAIVIIIILAVLLVIFTLQNSISISLHVFLWEFNNVPLVLLLIGCVVIGYFIASVYFYPRLWQRKKEFKKLQKAHKKLEELHQSIDPETESQEKEEKNPEGIEMKDDDEDSFFKE